MSGCLKQDKVSGSRVLHTLDLEKSFSFRGQIPLIPTRGVTHGLHLGPSAAPWTPTFSLFDFPPIPSLVICESLSMWIVCVYICAHPQVVIGVFVSRCVCMCACVFYQTCKILNWEKVKFSSLMLTDRWSSITCALKGWWYSTCADLLIQINMFVDRLVIQGYKRALVRSDLWSLNAEDTSASVKELYEKHWQKQLSPSKRSVNCLSCSRMPWPKCYRVQV